MDLGGNDNFIFCGCDKLPYQTPTSPALPRKLWGSSAHTGHSAGKQGLHFCHSKQNRIIQVSFSGFTAEKYKEITLLFLAVLRGGAYSEQVKAERVSNCLPPGDRDVSKLSNNMEHAYFLAPEKLRFLQSKPPHTCGIRHVKENELCQPGCACTLTRACSSALAARL